MELGQLAPSVTAPELPRPGIGGRALGALFFVVALVMFGMAFSNAAHAGGIAGTHGTLTVKSCRVEHSGTTGHRSETTWCEGTFRSGDGRSTDDTATVRADRKPGDKIPVQQSGNEYLRTGPGEVSRWIALFFCGWVVAAIGLPFAATGMFPRSGAQMLMINRSVSGTRAGEVRKWLFLVGIGGAAVCMLFTWMQSQ
ncbi:hypothetical protein Stsp01_58110 [Streptomyces sp. NBRC 13847]|uniref:hypothetical protein n=1 Tax=Streptomyces TaxID=1883 RepID=UPI0024A48E0D|nr:hypothetical protein [Streptomyces sp. NBRC 13847]GLW19068.1 hypothetical protein Stsp01_58110 [Streptomyces sp. NBRC 13847]